jgi:hypothetical protein
MTMPYAIIQPPFTLKFREMPKQELKDYFRWFFDVLPQRISELTKAVNGTPGYETWQPDQTPVSLDSLGEWFVSQAETRQRTPEEIQEIENRLTFPIEIPNDELTTRAISLAMDIGMYISQVFVKNHPSLQWEQPLKGSKRFIDYGQPVLIGFGAMPFNPVGMMITHAYGLASKRRTGNGLRKIYDIWAKMIPASVARM